MAAGRGHSGSIADDARGREAVLRWRFKAIVDEMTQTRDALLRTRFGQIAAPGKAKKKPSGRPGKGPDNRRKTLRRGRGSPACGGHRRGRGSAGGRTSHPGREPGEEAEPWRSSPEQQLDLQHSLVQLAIQTGRKNAQEPLGVAEGFDDICLQLANNRMDSEGCGGLGRASPPLHKIVEQMFPELERRLEALEAAVADPGRGPECRTWPCRPKTGRRHPPGHAGGSQPDGGDVRL